MIIVSGHLYVAPEVRDAYLAGCVEVVEQARATAGCLDFALAADLVEPGRINVYERWESEAALEAFRGDGTSDEQSVQILDAEVHRYRISSVEPA
ncbi:MULTISPECIES: putative quinol monooxygenase [Sphaerimonospora]|uniref:Antibiotic biosynthesis monooxygenase n=2 Tax=Sphaerimonospora TaxID=1792303 RepID=A0A8J3RET9_9ACTN|nr:antibiotic biosynthesis monooxygenase [Sphaerimonospora thailandensis]GIH72537.1 antibiotic biosynthesis monooxygenase [Sphaerimonospora thailandensis]